jgi:phosphotransferase system HPr (HPr) family protein
LTVARSTELVIHNRSGLHARPAAKFVQAAAGFRSSITVRNASRNGTAVDAKSILGVLGLGVSMGHRIVLTVNGDDEDAAIVGLTELVESGIGERED